MKQNRNEVKFLMHITKLHRRLRYMERDKRAKPLFSQAVDRLGRMIEELFVYDDRPDDSIIEQREEESPDKQMASMDHKYDQSLERSLISAGNTDRFSPRIVNSRENLST